jgi:hypothetical protein
MSISSLIGTYTIRVGDNPVEDRSSFLSISLTIALDSYPKESKYEVYYLATGDDVPLEEWETIATMDAWDWEFLDEMNGLTDGVHSHLVPRYFVDQSPGWYWLHIEDSNRDGICCRFRRGWVSLTAPIVTTMDVGLVWGNNGEYQAGVDVYFYMDADGVVAHVHWVMADGETGSAGGEDSGISMATERDALEGMAGKGGGRLRTRHL